MVSLFRRLRNVLRAPPPLEIRFSKAGSAIAMGYAGRPVWTPRDYKELAKESYEKNAVAYRAIAEIAKCVGSVPFELYRGTGEDREEIETHPLLDLLERPNPMQSRAQWMQALTGFFLIAGNSWLESVGPRGQPPRELWNKRPDRMKVVPGSRGNPEAYAFYAGQGNAVTWPVNQLTGMSNILHIKSFHPTNDWYGLSPIEAAAYSVDQHNESGRWNMMRLQNDARPSGAFVVDTKAATGLDDVQFQRLQKQIDEKRGGPENAGRPLLLEGGLDWREMGLNAVEMDWLGGRHTAARDVAMVFGMPPQMLGIPGDNTHRNMEEARLWLWEQTIIPFLDFVLSELNWWLTPRFGSDLELAFDLDEVAALIPRRHQLWDKVNASEFLTINEKRAAVGYEPHPEGDVIIVRKNSRRLEDEDAGSSEPGSEDPNLPENSRGLRIV